MPVNAPNPGLQITGVPLYYTLSIFYIFFFGIFDSNNNLGTVVMEKGFFSLCLFMLFTEFSPKRQ